MYYLKMLILLIFDVGFVENFMAVCFGFCSPSGVMGAAMSPPCAELANACGSGFFHAAAFAFDFD